jgi:hypothetical protein
MQEILRLFQDMDLEPMDFIGFPLRDEHIDPKALKELLRNSQDQGWVPQGLGSLTDGPLPHGGIFEVAGDLNASNFREFCARVAKIKDARGARRQFMTRVLGGFDWYPEEPMDLDNFADRYESKPNPDKPLVVRVPDEQADPDNLIKPAYPVPIV